ncbi:MAG TPA: FHA domain-containing protein [bacterium]|nr:FHA domain-containing protein [bacterium]
MSLYEERDVLLSEKDVLAERLQKLEERKDKVKPQLYEKLRGELDEKIDENMAKLADLEAQIRAEEERLAAEKAAEEARLAAERAAEEAREAAERAAEEARLAAEKAQQSEDQLREKILEKYADELEALQSEWRQVQEQRKQELAKHSDALTAQRNEISDSLTKFKDEKEELELRLEIGEFEDNPAEYDELTEKIKRGLEEAEAEINALDGEIGKVGEQIESLELAEMPDFAEQVVENHADELTGPEPEEEIYEPEEEVYEPDAELTAEGEILEEEELGEDAVADNEEILTEVEEIYEDETEEAFFLSHKRQSLISATINPCVIERLADGKEKIHELVLGGAKTLIGSSELCDVYLPYPTIEPKHAWIKVDRKGKYMLKDTSSKLGTLVNGKKIKKTFLENGDQIRIGDIRLQVKLI